MDEKLLITGGQGALGAWIARVLLGEGRPFVLLDAHPRNSILAQVIEPELLPSLTRVFGDPRDAARLARVAEEHQITRAIHLDGRAGPADLRALTIYGVGSEAGPGGVLTRAIRAAALGRAFAVPFTGAARFAHVEDVARAIVAAARLEAGEAVPVEEFIRALVEAVPEAAGRVTCAGEPLEVPVEMEDAAEGQSGAPSLPPTPFREGILRTAEMFRRLAEEGRLHDR